MKNKEHIQKRKGWYYYHYYYYYYFKGSKPNMVISQKKLDNNI
jgi:hypothetical protein